MIEGQKPQQRFGDADIIYYKVLSTPQFEITIN